MATSSRLALAVAVVVASTGSAPAQRPDAEPAARVDGSVRPEPVPAAAVDVLQWVRIPAGAVMLGCVPADTDCFDREKPRHEVMLSKPFEMLATEVTRAQWRQYALATDTAMPPAPEFPQTDAHPIVNVTWDEARAFCAWAGGRLPTEAEWEHAARGGRADAIYPWGNEPSHEFANYGRNGCCGGLATGRDAWEYTSPVASFPPNGSGLYDMAGNVWEWVGDWFGEDYYAASPSADAAGPGSGTARVTRGGSWYTYPLYIRASYRVRNRPIARYDDFGVRCVRPVAP